MEVFFIVCRYWQRRMFTPVQQLRYVQAPGFEITSLLRDSPGVANGTEDTGIRGNFYFLKNWLLFSSNVFNHPSRRKWESPVYKQ
jgi:hypothetical protein